MMPPDRVVPPLPRVRRAPLALPPLALLPALLLTGGTRLAAQAPAPAALRPLPAPPAAPAAAPQPPASSPRLVAGGVLGGALGLLAGGVAGAAIGRSQGCDAEEWVCALHGAMAGAAVGTSLGIPWGAHAAGGRRGALAGSTLASLALGAAGVAGLRATHYDAPWAPVILVATPLAQLAAVVAIERRGR